MCGRAALNKSRAALMAATGAVHSEDNVPDHVSNYNITPMSTTPVVVMKRRRWSPQQQGQDRDGDGSGERGGATLTSTSMQLRHQNDAYTRVLTMMNWGFKVDPHARKGSTPIASPLMINARSETVLSKPTFRNLVKFNRCIIPLDGFFEWHKVNVPQSDKVDKRPYFVTLKHGHGQLRSEMMFMAGLYRPLGESERAEDEETGERGSSKKDLDDEGEESKEDDETTKGVTPSEVAYHGDGGKGSSGSFVIVTTAATNAFDWLHDRLPLMLSREDAVKWLQTGEYSADEMTPLMTVQYQKEHHSLNMTRVTDYVNSTKNKGKECIEAFEDVEERKKKNGIRRFFAASPVKAPAPGPTSNRDDISCHDERLQHATFASFSTSSPALKNSGVSAKVRTLMSPASLTSSSAPSSACPASPSAFPLMTAHPPPAFSLGNKRKVFSSLAVIKGPVDAFFKKQKL